MLVNVLCPNMLYIVPHFRFQTSIHPSGLCNRMYIIEYHGLGGLNNQHLFLTLLEAGKSKIKMMTDSMSGERKPVLQFIDSHSQYVSSHGGSIKGALWGLL